MNNKYFNKTTKLLKKIHPQLIRTHKVEFKNFFGAVAGYVDGHIFISCGRFGVALKLPSEILENLFNEKGVKRLKYFPSGHVKKEYAVFPKRILENKRWFKKFMDKSIRYAMRGKNV